MLEMEEEIKEIINGILESKGEQKVENMLRETELRKDLGFDSFDLAELTVKIESRFGKDIFEGGLIKSVGEILDKLSES